MVLHQGEEFSGIVVSKRDYKERDLLVKILTNRYGYKTFYIRGAKNAGSDLAQLFCLFRMDAISEALMMTACHILAPEKKLTNIKIFLTISC